MFLLIPIFSDITSAPTPIINYWASVVISEKTPSPNLTLLISSNNTSIDRS